MLLRPMDSQGDMIPLTRKSQLLSGVEAVAAIIKSRFTLHLGTWWEDEEVGSPVFGQLIEGVRTGDQKDALGHLISAYILDTPGVLEIKNPTMTSPTSKRVLQYSCTVLTTYGQTELVVSADELLPSLY